MVGWKHSPVLIFYNSTVAVELRRLLLQRHLLLLSLPLHCTQILLRSLACDVGHPEGLLLTRHGVDHRLRSVECPGVPRVVGKARLAAIRLSCRDRYSRAEVDSILGSVPNTSTRQVNSIYIGRSLAKRNAVSVNSRASSQILLKRRRDSLSAQFRISISTALTRHRAVKLVRGWVYTRRAESGRPLRVGVNIWVVLLHPAHRFSNDRISLDSIYLCCYVCSIRSTCATKRPIRIRDEIFVLVGLQAPSWGFLGAGSGGSVV